jgi:fructan beta-fructosidase
MKKTNQIIRYFIFLVLIIVPFSSCNNKNPATEYTSSGYYNEQYRPQFHFSPEANWMNDPNGLVFYNGEYHLFYQYYPDSTVWGPMHWGHALSTDLVHWNHLPVALYPDTLGYIFSGSAAVDTKNTSGLGSEQNPALVAIFTYHNPLLEKEGSNIFQNQGLAFSIDKGRTWTKYSGNPVLKNPGIPNFRDPKVSWHEGTGKWIMILAVNDKVQLYSSPDLKNWTFESDFGKDIGAHGGVWECPDLFQLPVEGGDEKKWVMLVSINPGGPNGGSATQYFTGKFDGHKFIPDETAEKWVDWGTDNYAGVTWSDIPESDGRRLFIGWMSNWKYAAVVPTTTWRSAMTIPRQLYLTSENGHYTLISKPAEELKKLRKEIKSLSFKPGKYSDNQVIPTDTLKLSQSELIFDFNLADNHSDSVGIVLENNQGERLIIGYSVPGKQFFVDRTNSGNSGFSKEFAGIATTPYEAAGKIRMHLYIDASSVELFADDGKLVMTSLVFPTEEFTKLKVLSKGGTALIDKVEFYELERIWP